MDSYTQRKYLHLEQLTTEELEKLLAQDFNASNAADPNMEYIQAILGIIKEREIDSGHLDVESAWKDFQENYC